MTLPSGAHVEIGGVGYRLDEGYEQALGRRCYSHGGRSIFAEQFNITGIPGARNLKQDDLLWHITNFTGEGQVVLNNDDPDSASLFYRSEGLDFRVAGQATLNRSIATKSLPLAGASGTTFQGNANMADVVGTSTTSGTDRQINDASGDVQTSTGVTPGAGSLRVDYYLYRTTFTDQDTEISGENWKLKQGEGEPDVPNTQFKLKRGTARTATKSTGTHFDANVVARIEVDVQLQLTANVPGPHKTVTIKVVDVTNADSPQVVASQNYTYSDSSTHTAAVNWTPKANKDYQFHIQTQEDQGITLLIDIARYGPAEGPNTVIPYIYNQTGGTTVATGDFTVSATAADKLVCSLQYNTSGGTEYRFGVIRSTGSQYIWVDKIVATDLSGTTWVNNAIELGLGGKVWAAASEAGSNTRLWRYDPTDDTWEDSGGTEGSFAELNDVTLTTGAVVRALTHSDKYEYAVLSNDEVYSVDASGTDDRYAYFSAGARDLVGGVVCQERLILMGEDSSGVIIYALPLDSTSTPYDIATSPSVQPYTITAGQKTPDTSLRQRMCSTPTGARFFLNFGDETSKVYEVNTTGSTLEHKELADLGRGVVAKAIAYEGGLTWIAAQYVAESDQTARSVLFFIDQNGVLNRDHFFRFDAPDSDAPVALVPYQTDLWILQGEHVWRRSLTTGGLYHEYELTPTTSSEARGIAVSAGRVWALYEDEVQVAGTESAYRQSSDSGGSSITTSINDLGLPGVTKSLLSIKVLTKELPSGAQVVVEYQTDGDGTWTTAGTHEDGSSSTFFVATSIDPVTYNTLQLRLTLVSTNGTATPTLLGVVVTSRASEQEEYWDLVLRTEDIDSSDLPLGEEGKTLLGAGNPRAQHLINLWRTAAPVTFRDGYASKVNGDVTDHIVTVGDFRDERTMTGEGRVVCTLKAVK